MTTQNESVLLITVGAPNPNGMASLAAYGKASGPLLHQFGGTLVAQMSIAEHLHGDTPAKLIGIAEFPNMAALRAFFESDEYQPLIPLRDEGLTSLQIYFSAPGQSAENLKNAAAGARLIVMAQPNMNEKAALGQYQKGAGPIFGKNGAKPLANIRVAEKYFGDSDVASIAILAFPSSEAVHATFDNEAYQQLIPIRDKALTALDLYLA